MIRIEKLTSRDRGAWENLFRAYNDFYERSLPEETYERAWTAFQEDAVLHALGATLDSTLVGIAHFFSHASTTSADACYLQDLFTAPPARGQGVARGLIAAVTEWARGQGHSRMYWQTREDNRQARHLYDQVASHRGFVVYQIDLQDLPIA